jgi:hypothetical protein
VLLLLLVSVAVVGFCCVVDIAVVIVVVVVVVVVVVAAAAAAAAVVVVVAVVVGTRDKKTVVWQSLKREARTLRRRQRKVLKRVEKRPISDYHPQGPPARRKIEGEEDHPFKEYSPA